MDDLARGAAVPGLLEAEIAGILLAYLLTVGREHGTTAQVVDLYPDDRDPLDVGLYGGGKVAQSRMCRELIGGHPVGGGEIRGEHRPERIREHASDGGVVGLPLYDQLANVDLVIEHSKDDRDRDDGNEARQRKVA